MSGSVCPFCKSVTPDPQAACPHCGRRSEAIPDLKGWGDDDLGGGLDLSRGVSVGEPSGQSAYGGGNLALNDDDPFADDVSDRGSLELDLPPSHGSARGGAAPAPSLASAAAAREPAVPAPAPAAATPTPAPASAPGIAAANPNDPTLAADRPQEPHPVAAPAAPDPAAMIARYPKPPSKVVEAPAYAIKVLWRQLELRQDLASLRKRRSPDVGLYERALEAHDPKSFTLGLVLVCAALTLALFLFFLPVILRFVADPS